MIEETVKIYLENNGISAPVLMELPKNIPSECVIIEKTGSALEDHIYQSTIAIQSYAPSKYEAAKANEKIVGLMIYGLVNEPDIARVALNSDYDYPDLANKRYRYQAVFDITHY